MFLRFFATLLLVTSAVIAVAQNNSVLFPVQINGDSTNNYRSKAGYIDITGKLVVPYVYNETKEFSEGIGLVKKEGKIGYINSIGKEIIPCKYDLGDGFLCGYAWVKKGSKSFYIDKNGRKLKIKNADEYRSNNLFRIRVKGLYGFVNAKKKVIIPANIEYTPTPKFIDGYAVAKIKGEYYVLDTLGKTILNTKKTLITVLTRDYLEFVDKKIGVMDMKGNVVLEPEYGDITYCGDNIFCAIDRSSYERTYMDKAGKTVKAPRPYNQEYYITISGEEYNYTVNLMNSKGELIKTFGTETMSPSNTVMFKNGLCRLELTPPKSDEDNAINGQPVYINTKGEIVWKGDAYHSCFPASATIKMADGTDKLISEINEGDSILSINEETKITYASIVDKVEMHKGKFSITEITAYSPLVVWASLNSTLLENSWTIEATPNHPLITKNGIVEVGKINTGDIIYTLDEKRGLIIEATVRKSETKAIRISTVYNLKTSAGNYFVNGILVLVK